MLEKVRAFLFGAPIPPAGAAAIPDEAREAHHRLVNTAMRVKQNSRVIEREANVIGRDANDLLDVLEALARDLRKRDRE